MTEINSIWKTDEFKPLHLAWENRVATLQGRERFYYGSVGASVLPGNQYDHDALSMVQQASGMAGAQQQIKLLFHPLAGAVHVDVGLVPGGWQLDDDSAELNTAKTIALKTSQWQLWQDAYVHAGATMGQSTLRVWNNPETGGVWLRPMRPDMVLPVYKSAYDRTMRMAIIVSKQTMDGAAVEVAEVIEPTRIRTFVNGQPMAIGDVPAEVDNELGFVPVVDQPFVFTGKNGLGECTYQSAITPISEANTMGSQLAELVRKHVEPQWAAFIEAPAENASDLQKSGDNLWWFPTGSSIQALVAALDIDGVLAFVKEIKSDVLDNLPERLLYQLVGMNRIAVPAIEVQLLPLTIKIHRIRRSVDAGLATALRMVGRAAAQMGNAPDGLSELDTPLLGFREQRPVILMDALSALELDSQRLAVDSQRMALEQDRMLAGGDE